MQGKVSFGAVACWQRDAKGNRNPDKPVIVSGHRDDRVIYLTLILKAQNM